jgi:alkaline phosphatase D
MDQTGGRTSLPTAQVGRRGFLLAGGAAVGLAAAAVSARGAPALAAGRSLPADPFTLRVASGDPLEDGVVLWTRLAPDPLDGGGMPDRPVPVQWEVGTDERLSRVVRRGVAPALSEAAHSVHVDVRGLRPGAWYWYRFRVGRHQSPVGRTRTAPASGWLPDRLRFAFVSCQNFQQGFWPAYANLAAEDLELVVHLGDYLYEEGADPLAPRQHLGGEPTTLAEYRTRHAQYKSDPALQAAHQAFPWALTWDDHEVENNYADGVPEDPAATPGFLARRAAAYRAYWEHLPLRRRQVPQGPDLRLFRRLPFGRLAEFAVLDTRQYRSDQPSGDGIQVRCPAALEPAQTMTGPRQERWLLAGLAGSRARWNVLAQQTMMAQMDFAAGQVALYNMDQWDGYVAARARLLGFLHQRSIANTVVISGDIHSSWAADLKADFDDPASATVASEFVGTSVSSDFPAAFIPLVRAALPENPHVKYFDGALRGYVRCELDVARWRTDYRVVPSVAVPTGGVSTAASFEVEAGHPGVHPA